MKKLLSTIITLSIISFSAVTTLAADDISVTLDGKEIAFDKAPQIMNGRVMVPMRKAFEAIDAKISWDGEASAATAVKDALYAKFTNGADTMELGVCKDGKDDGEQVYYSNEPLDSAPVIIDGTMYVPMRALAETFHYNVEWNADKKTAEITTPTDADGWIYYASWSDGGHMYKADTNGQHRELLSTDDCYLKWNFAYGSGYIFYSIREEEKSKEGCLYRIKTDGTGAEKLTDNPVEMLYDEKDYLSSYSPDENGDIFFLMCADENKDGYSYEEDMYICKVNTESGEVTRLSDYLVKDYKVNLYGDYIFFQQSSDEFDKMFSYYRMDKNGENIIKVTGDYATYYFNFDKDNDRIVFSSTYSGSGYYYSAELDGSDVQKHEGSWYDYVYGLGKYDLKYVRHYGDGFAVGYNDGEKRDTLYVVDEDGNELSVIKVPEGYSISITSIDNKIYYSTYLTPTYEKKKLYVDSLDELLGAEYISVSEEMVDGKYEITFAYDYEDNIPLEDAEIHSVNLDGSDDKLILRDYDLSHAINDRLLIWGQDGEGYTCDVNGGDIQPFEMSGLNKNYGVTNDNAHYGIVVKNDGTVEPYKGNNNY